MNSGQLKRLTSVAVVAVVLSALGAMPANAAIAGSTSTIDTLVVHGLVSLNSNAKVQAVAATGVEVSTLAGLVVPTKTGTVSIAPVSATAATVVTRDVITYDTTSPSYDFAVTRAGDSAKANAAYVVINDASAPDDYRFTVTVNGGPAQLELMNGIVFIKDASGTAVNFLQAPWVEDATGRQLATSYSVNGTTVTQHVNHAGASYPVVADPATACDALNCTVEFSKSETRQAASSSGLAAVLFTTACTLLGAEIGAFVCGAYSAWMIDTANQAQNQGKCLGVRAIHYPIGIAASPYPVVYSGGNCR